MPVHVAVPARLRIDPAALRDRRDELEEALAAAAGRALTRSREVVLAERGGYVGVRLHAPVVTWTGASLAAVPPELRARVEGRLAAVLFGMAERTGMLDGARDGQQTPFPLQDRAAEPADTARLASLLGRYLLPSYLAGGRSRTVSVVGEAHVTAVETSVELPLEWRRIGSREELGEQLEATFRASGRPVPSSGYLGAIYRHADTGALRLAVVRRRGDGEDLLFDVALRLYELRPAGAGPNPELEKVAGGLLPLPAAYRVRRLAGSAHQVFERRNGPALRTAIQAEATRRGLRVSAQETDAAVKVLVAECVRHLGWSEASGFVDLVVDGRPVVPLALPTSPPAGLDAEVIPLLQAAPPELPAIVQATQERAEGDGTTFPTAPATQPRGSTCGPLLDEPPVAELGAAGDRLRELIEDIATALKIPPCDHAARFCLEAAAVLGQRALAVGERADTLTGKRRLEGGQFQPSDSPGLQLLRHLAGVAPRLSRLERMILHAYQLPEHRERVGGQYGPIGHWMGRFESTLTPVRRRAVGHVFAAACRLILLELLRSSHEGIVARQQPRILNTYAPMFELLLRSHAAGLAELRRLREALAAAQGGVTGLIGREVYQSWRQVRKALVEELGQAPQLKLPSASPGTIVEVDGKPAGITDQTGRTWSAGELDMAIELAEQSTEAVDPLVSQVRDVAQLLERARTDPSAVRQELERLLAEMLRENERVDGEVTGDNLYAFRAGYLVPVRGGGGSLPGLPYILRGIHLLAHREVGQSFADDVWYVDGLTWLLDVVRGTDKLAEDVASIAGVVPGGQLGAQLIDLQLERHALERKAVFRSLLGARAVLRWADIEAELFGRELGLALGFLPLGRKLAGAARTGAKATTRTTLAGAARIAGRKLARTVTRELVDQLKKELVEAVAEELVKDWVVGLLVEEIVAKPSLAALELEAGLTTGTFIQLQEAVAGAGPRPGPGPEAAKEERDDGG